MCGKALPFRSSSFSEATLSFPRRTLDFLLTRTRKGKPFRTSAGQSRALRNRNRKRQEAERKDEQCYNRNRDSLRPERLHLLRLRVTNAQHDGEQGDINEAARAAVPKPTQHRNDCHGHKRCLTNPPVHAFAEN